LVIEAHSVEDVSNMGGTLGTIRQAAVLRARLVINLVTPAWLPVDLWACMNTQNMSCKVWSSILSGMMACFKLSIMPG